MSRNGGGRCRLGSNVDGGGGGGGKYRYTTDMAISIPIISQATSVLAWPTIHTHNVVGECGLLLLLLLVEYSGHSAHTRTNKDYEINSDYVNKQQNQQQSTLNGHRFRPSGNDMGQS